eukprot:gnl/TRDRNA2_/TRDRNA2_207471_c0_seq1.p1 gnl/TRDRNA2_/TRDRNA2_207471_c0~~gnl/TRDRNA2_/TRDRNA2_207471_c0_seq1.p1  ORF type:complete len:203 (-),score=32.34 gnl/TRDRNA2_/TRDRNA2_207471_c0_seq1:74-682(-)
MSRGAKSHSQYLAFNAEQRGGLSGSSSESLLLQPSSASTDDSIPSNRPTTPDLEMPPGLLRRSSSSASQPAHKASSSEVPAESTEPISSQNKLGGSARPAVPQGYATVGSAMHDVGKCKPCLWFLSEIGCTYEANCANCHFQHFGRAKPSKAKRDSVRRRAAAQAAEARAAAAAQAAPAVREEQLRGGEESDQRVQAHIISL